MIPEACGSNHRLRSNVASSATGQVDYILGMCPSTSTNPTVRAATRDDLNDLVELGISIQELHAKGRPDLFRDPDPEALREFLDLKLSDGSAVLIAKDNRQSLGYLLAEHTTRPANPFRRSSSSLYVHHIAVAVTAQHKGVGKLLMNAAVKITQDNDAAAIRLDSWQFND
ncbi:ribosomal protein S18 acetylase RimI-like enzyme [Arthrobacter sp. CAN_A212]|uniref:GNAT family N-acetyltransferase n=1 Tax=Arthrobacter sp. CAN_A212 TaxID=2787719 RepID=UPI0018CB7725